VRGGEGGGGRARTSGAFAINIGIIITSVRYDYYVYRLLNMYLSI